MEDEKNEPEDSTGITVTDLGKSGGPLKVRVMGRPLKGDKPRTARVTALIAQEDLEAIHAARGTRTLSDWVDEAIREKLARDSGEDQELRK